MNKKLLKLSKLCTLFEHNLVKRSFEYTKNNKIFVPLSFFANPFVLVLWIALVKHRFMNNVAIMPLHF